MVAILAASLPVLIYLQQTETECLRTYKEIHENNKTPGMQLAEPESIRHQKLLIIQYVDNNCPKFTDLEILYKSYTGNDLPK